MPALPGLPSAQEIVSLQVDLVRTWHGISIEDVGVGLRRIIAQQHAANFRLWHEEDKARSPDASDREIAAVKRAIDGLNQQRNDLIEKVDDAIAELMINTQVATAPGATLNTETPGSAIDRLSIMALRLYHYREQLQREGVDASHMERVRSRVALCEQQHADLTNSLQELLDDLFAGRKRHRTYRQMKMYNDPNLNPSIYGNG